MRSSARKLQILEGGGPDLSEMVNALSSSHYRGGNIGVYLGVKARIRFLATIRQFLSERKIKATESSIEFPQDADHSLFSFIEGQSLLNDQLGQSSKLDIVNNYLQLFQNALNRLDINHTIDQQCPCYSRARALLAKFSVQHIREIAGYPSSPRADAIIDALRHSLRRQRVHGYRQRLIEEVNYAANRGWYVVFDTLTLAPEHVKNFEADPYALRDHMRKLGRMANRAEGVPAGDSFNERFKYFCVPEFGGKNGRLHFHAVYIFRTLPGACVDPNVGRKHCNLREIRSLKCWSWGFSSPIAVRYSGDAFTRAGWLWPKKKVDNGTFAAIDVKPPLAIAFYLTDYVSKNLDGVHSECRTTKRKYRIRMTRKFGFRLPSVQHLSNSALLEMTKLHWTVDRRAMQIAKSASFETRRRLAHVSVRKFSEIRTSRPNLLELLRALTRSTPAPKQLSSFESVTPKLMMADISDEVRDWLSNTEPLSGGIPVSGR